MNFQSHVINYINDNNLGDIIQRCDYDHFKVVIPLGPDCSKHVVADEKQITEILDFFKAKKIDIKPIYSSDAQIEWLGAQPGQLIIITRINSSTGYGTDYRRVVKINNY
jgi:DNA-directed RNA polymerase subunit H (RpoH/RPB5)